VNLSIVLDISSGPTALCGLSFDSFSRTAPSVMKDSTCSVALLFVVLQHGCTDMLLLTGEKTNVK
jgi:hypothetical protein